MPILVTFQTPETVGAGQLRLAAAPGAASFGHDADADPFPTTEFSLRYGATESVDLGLKLYPVGLEFGLKWQFLDTEGFDAAITPAVAGIFLSSGDDSGGALYAHLALLFGAHLSETVTIGFGPKFMYALLLTDVTTSSIDALEGVFGGLYLGVPIHLGDRFTIAPEINVYSDFSAFGAGPFNFLLLQGGVTFMFDFFSDPASDSEPSTPSTGPVAPSGY